MQVNWMEESRISYNPDLIKRKFGLKVRLECSWTGWNTPRICYITPILKDLHWFPIKYRNEFKIVLLTFKCLYGLAPQYLVDLIAVAAQSRYNLRSRNATLLVPANVRCLPTLGDRAFQSTKLWNNPIFWRRSETFWASHLLSELLKRTFLR